METLAGGNAGGAFPCEAGTAQPGCACLGCAQARAAATPAAADAAAKVRRLRVDAVRGTTMSALFQHGAVGTLQGPAPPPDGPKLAGVSDLASLGTAGTRRLAGPPAIGINFLHTYEVSGDDRYPAVASALGDVRRLSGRFVRQPGANLYWPKESGSGGDTIDLPVAPYDEATGTFDLTPLVDAWVVHQETSLVALLQAASAHGIDLVLTLVTAGGGGPQFGLADPQGEFKTLHVPQLTWAPEHDGQTVPGTDGASVAFEELELLVGGAAAIGGDALEDAWLFNTLDIRSPYKRKYLELMAEAIIRGLFEIGETGEFDPIERVIAIEVFNEINTTCLPDGAAGLDLELSAAPWAKAVAAALRGAQAGFAAVGRSAPPFWLPSLASGTKNQPWGVGASPATGTVLSFEASFLSALRSELGSLSDFPNQDAHWYHFTSDQEPDRPAACIVQDVESMRSVLAAAGSTATVTLCETGFPCGGSEVSAKTFPALQDAMRTGDAEAVQEFQAREVWRRLPLALAAGCSCVAWHTLVSESSGTFGLCGLREDESGETDSRNLQARLSWGALSRIAEWFAPAAGAPSITLKWPTHSLAANFEDLDLGSGSQMLLVVEFAFPSRDEWYYLLMLDSIATATEATGRFWPRGGNTTYSVFPAVPWSWEGGALVAAHALPSLDPVFTPGIGEAALTTEGWPFTVRRDVEPRVMRARRRLRFSVDG